MNISNTGKIMIVNLEGLRYDAYDDATGQPITNTTKLVGRPTIGVGHLVTKKEYESGVIRIYEGANFEDVHWRDGLTDKQIMKLLAMDLKQAELIIENHVKVALTQSQHDSLISFIFNIGPGKKGSKDGFVTLKNGQPSTILIKLNAGDYEGARDEMEKWVKADGKINEGLVNRRNKEIEMWDKGVWS